MYVNSCIWYNMQPVMKTAKDQYLKKNEIDGEDEIEIEDMLKNIN